MEVLQNQLKQTSDTSMKQAHEIEKLNAKLLHYQQLGARLQQISDASTLKLQQAENKLSEEMLTYQKLRKQIDALQTDKQAQGETIKRLLKEQKDSDASSKAMLKRAEEKLKKYGETADRTQSMAPNIKQALQALVRLQQGNTSDQITKLKLGVSYDDITQLKILLQQILSAQTQQEILK